MCACVNACFLLGDCCVAFFVCLCVLFYVCVYVCSFVFYACMFVCVCVCMVVLHFGCLCIVACTHVCMYRFVCMYGCMSLYAPPRSCHACRVCIDAAAHAGGMLAAVAAYHVCLFSRWGSLKSAVGYMCHCGICLVFCSTTTGEHEQIRW